MKRQMKIAAVVSATALLAIGASFTSMAAAKVGTWKPSEDGQWYCYDKNGDMYENEFCLDGGKEFYVGDDGAMVYSQWVEHDGEMYYIGSDGSKTTSAWKWLTPYEDEDADEEWYWFTASGKRANDKKVAVDGKTYYFDGDGKMLTGWVDLSVAGDVEQAEKGDEAHISKLVYCDENGARVTKNWVLAYEPGVDVEEDDLDLYDEYWYYLKSLGAPTTGKASNINGETYLFDVEGKMLSGWIANTDNGYVEIDDNGDDEKTLAEHAELGNTVYYACTEDGHVKKNKWIKEWNNQRFAKQDPDLGKNWFWIEKDGKVFVPTTGSNAINSVDFSDGTVGLVIDETTSSNATMKKINNEIYAFNDNGQMMSGLMNFVGEGVMYFGGSNDGAMKIGAQTITDDVDDAYKFYFGTEDEHGYFKGIGITGAKNGKLYEDGLLVVADGDFKYEVVTLEGNGCTYIVNKNGNIQTSKDDYKDDGYVVVDASACTFVTIAGTTKGSVEDATKLVYPAN